MTSDCRLHDPSNRSTLDIPFTRQAVTAHEILLDRRIMHFTQVGVSKRKKDILYIEEPLKQFFIIFSFFVQVMEILRFELIINIGFF